MEQTKKSQSQKRFNENYRISIWCQFKLVCCAKYDRGLDLGFWEILKPLKWTNITDFFVNVLELHHSMEQ
jgi:hypothetical protein